MLTTRKDWPVAIESVAIRADREGAELHWQPAPGDLDDDALDRVAEAHAHIEVPQLVAVALFRNEGDRVMNPLLGIPDANHTDPPDDDTVWPSIATIPVPGFFPCILSSTPALPGSHPFMETMYREGWQAVLYEMQATLMDPDWDTEWGTRNRDRDDLD